MLIINFPFYLLENEDRNLETQESKALTGLRLLDYSIENMNLGFFHTLIMIIIPDKSESKI